MFVYVWLSDRLVAYWTGHHWDRMPCYVCCTVSCFTVEQYSKRLESVVIKHATRLKCKARQDCGDRVQLLKWYIKVQGSSTSSLIRRQCRHEAIEFSLLRQSSNYRSFQRQSRQPGKLMYISDRSGPTPFLCVYANQSLNHVYYIHRSITSKPGLTLYLTHHQSIPNLSAAYRWSQAA